MLCHVWKRPFYFILFSFSIEFIQNRFKISYAHSIVKTLMLVMQIIQKKISFFIDAIKIVPLLKGSVCRKFELMKMKLWKIVENKIKYTALPSFGQLSAFQFLLRVLLVRNSYDYTDEST